MPHNARSDDLPEPLVNGIGTNSGAVRAMRESRGYSIEKLSLTCGLSVDEIEDIESGRVTDASKLHRIVSALRLVHETLIMPTIPPVQGRSLA